MRVMAQTLDGAIEDLRRRGGGVDCISGTDIRDGSRWILLIAVEAPAQENLFQIVEEAGRAVRGVAENSINHSRPDRPTQPAGKG